MMTLSVSVAVSFAGFVSAIGDEVMDAVFARVAGA